MQPRSIIECTENRKGERLVQGLLLFLLTNDQPFREAFCEWAGWPTDVEDVLEEKRKGNHRHDLHFRWPDNNTRNVELKLWAGPTTSQFEDPAGIDLFLVPQRYWGHEPIPFPKDKVHHWEDLQHQVIARSELAKTLLASLDQYAWTESIISRETIIEEVLAWWLNKDCDWRGNWFLHGCAECARKIGLRSTPANQVYRKDKVGYWGRYLKSRRHQVHPNQWLWFGFVFRVNAGQVEDLTFILQVPTALERALQCKPALPRWYPEDEGWGRTGIEVPAKENGHNVKDWWTACEACIRKYESL